MLRDAELAMFYAKRHGGDRIEAYRASARSIAALAKSTEEELQRAIKPRQIRMQFQPIWTLNTGRIVGAEALMRWHHPSAASIGPDEFVPLAERAGQIEQLGRLAFEQSAAQLRDLAERCQTARGFLRLGQSVAAPAGDRNHARRHPHAI